MPYNEFNVHNVEKILITKGDNLYSDENILCDRMIALQIEGKLYWLNEIFCAKSFDYVTDRIERSILVNIQGRKLKDLIFFINEDTSKKVTFVTKHHDDIMTEGSSYMKKTQENKQGELFWNIKDLKNHLENIASERQQQANSKNPLFTPN